MISFLLTLKLAAIVSVLLLLLGLPLAYWLAFTRFRFKFLLEAVLGLPLVLPPTVLGFYMLLLLGSNGPFTNFMRPLAFTFAGLVIASIFYSLPFAVQPFVAAFSAVDRRVLLAAELLGASRMRRFFTVLLPLALPGVVTGFALSFAHTIGEFGVVLMVGGNIPGVTRTISIAIYDNVQALDYASAHRTSLWLLLFSFSVLALVYGWNRRARQMWLME